MKQLLPLGTHPADDPAGWTVGAVLGPDPDAPGRTVAVLSAPGLAPEEGAAPDPAAVGAIERLSAAGVLLLGYVNLGYATRPLGDVVADITQWAALPIGGVFLDRAPAGPFQLGPVALALRTACRLGLAEAVLNPGVPVDPLYRELDATLCTFEGAWAEYLDWGGEGIEPGDGHLLYGVPDDDLENACGLARARGAGLCLAGAAPEWAQLAVAS